MEIEENLVCKPRSYDSEGNLAPPLPKWYLTLGSRCPKWDDAPYPNEPSRDSVLQWLLLQIKEVNLLEAIAEEHSTTSSLLTAECLRTTWRSATAETLSGLRLKRVRDVHRLLCALVAARYPDFDGMLVPVLPAGRERTVWQWDEVLAYLWECERAVAVPVATGEPTASSDGGSEVPAAVPVDNASDRHITIEEVRQSPSDALQHIARPDNSTSRRSTAVETQPQLSLQAKALALLTDEPSLSVSCIAKRLGCNRTTLYRYPVFKSAREVVRTSEQERRQSRIRRGSKSTDGTLEAVDFESPDVQSEF